MVYYKHDPPPRSDRTYMLRKSEAQTDPFRRTLFCRSEKPMPVPKGPSAFHDSCADTEPADRFCLHLYISADGLSSAWIETALDNRPFRRKTPPAVCFETMSESRPAPSRLSAPAAALDPLLSALPV